MVSEKIYMFSPFRVHGSYMLPWQPVFLYKQKYVHELLVNRLFKLAQGELWLGELTVPN